MADSPRRLTAVGFWFSHRAPNAYPLPDRLVGRWSSRRRAVVVNYLRRGAVYERYTASSFCRFGCGASAREMGHLDLFDGRFLWPEGLAHYVEAHGVRLPEWFVRAACAGSAGHSPVVRPRNRFGTVDDTRWLAWARERGACLDLSGWRRPSLDERLAVCRQLPYVREDAVLLLRGARVLVKGGRRIDPTGLEVWNLTPPRRVRQLTWGQWPG